jgi:hypothetical protein
MLDQMGQETVRYSAPGAVSIVSIKGIAHKSEVGRYAIVILLY